jgi:hypothetical protein
MLKFSRVMAVLGLLALSSHAFAASDVDVKFEGSEHYTDAVLYSNASGSNVDEQVVKQFSATFQKLGSRYLNGDQKLYIVIENIDLAGRFDAFNSYANSPSRVRIKDPASWPHVALRYVLVQPGQPDVSKEVKIADQQYLNRAGVNASSDQLKAEKNMLGDWFRREFGNSSVTMM